MPVRKGKSTRRRLMGISILHEDDDILAIDKPAGLLTIATDTEREHTAYHLLMDYVRKGCDRSPRRVFIVHRLDRETSGVLLFARTEQAKRRLQAQWPDTEKTYLAIVRGSLTQKADTITSYLTENAAFRVYSTQDRVHGLLSRTAYQVLAESNGLSLLEVRLLTGRKHQIRVHLADRGHPVVGDRKYGAPREACRQLALHARSIAFNHPVTGRRLVLTAEVPAFFEQLMGGIFSSPIRPR